MGGDRSVSVACAIIYAVCVVLEWSRHTNTQTHADFDAFVPHYCSRARESPGRTNMLYFVCIQIHMYVIYVGGFVAMWCSLARLCTKLCTTDSHVCIYTNNARSSVVQ